MPRTTIRTEDITADAVTAPKIATGAVPAFDDSGLQDDIALLAFKTQANGKISAKEALETLKKNNSSGTEFDLTAYNCLRRITSESKINELSPLLSQVENRYEHIKFSGNANKLTEQITETERSQIIEELTQLAKECAG